MLTPSIQGIVNGLADRLGLPVVLEDANQQLVAYSPHYDLMDRVREETILRRTTTQGVVDIFEAFDIVSQTLPTVIPANMAEGRLARLCIPIRYLDAVLGYAWVLLREEGVDADAFATAVQAQEQLGLTMLAESRVRARESDSLLSLISSDTDSRVQGLIDVESRGGFEAPRRLVVVVCSGPAWHDAGVRGSFWTAAWAPEAQYQLRGVTAREGVALISIRTTPGEEVGGMLTRALRHVSHHREDAALVIGVGGVVDTPDESHESYRQARLAARVALRDTGVAPVAWWDQLGVYRFLTQLPMQTLAASVDPRVASLVAGHPSFAETLECYLQESGAIGVVAKSLHIHRTTLYYRLDRVRSMGIQPNSGEDRTAVMTSLAALRLLGRWPLDDHRNS
ncbi:MAG: PucR family transcriptional regulator [Euzebya sp.]